MHYKLFLQDAIQNTVILQNSGLYLYLCLANHQADTRQHNVCKHFS